jgi:hypothetical protein
VTVSDQTNGDQSPPSPKGGKLSARAVMMAANIFGGAGFIVLVVALVATIAQWSRPPNFDSALRTLAVVMIQAAIVVVLYVLNKEDRRRNRERHAQIMREVQDRQKLILDRISQVAAESREDLERATDAWTGLQTSVDDALWRVTELADVVKGSEASASKRWEEATVRWDDFNARADRIDEQERTLGMLLIRVIDRFREHLPPLPAPGQVTRLDKRQGD